MVPQLYLLPSTVLKSACVPPIHVYFSFARWHVFLNFIEMVSYCTYLTFKKFLVLHSKTPMYVDEALLLCLNYLVLHYVIFHCLRVMLLMDTPGFCRVSVLELLQ